MKQNDNLIDEINAAILAASMDLNTIQSEQQVTVGHFGAHYVRVESQSAPACCGVREMLVELFHELGAVNKSGAVTVQKLRVEVVARFGEHRYPINTLRVYLTQNWPWGGRRMPEIVTIREAGQKHTRYYFDAALTA